MPFPTPPFELDDRDGKSADVVLISYMQKHPASFLSDNTRTELSKLDSSRSLGPQILPLLDIWKKILTDALRSLKQHDPREWDRKHGARVNYSSFFHEDSLGVGDLHELLTEFTHFEAMLYGASPEKYRDHIAHPFRVWAMGQGILADGACFAGSLDPDSNVVRSISSEEWQCMWAIASLCHDLGYPVSNIERINARARSALHKMGLVPQGDLRFGFSQQMLPFHDTVIRMIAARPILITGSRSYATHLQNKYYLKLLKSFDKLDHGVIGALLVSRALVYFLESDYVHDPGSKLNKEDARQFLIRREILRAIAAHTCPDIYHLRFDKLAFLLYMMDEIQCWGRPTLEQSARDAIGIAGQRVYVQELNDRRISVEIHTAEENWQPEQKVQAEQQLNRLRRMLRLGVGTVALRKRHLRFTVLPNDGNGVELLLNRGKITLDSVATKRKGRSPASAPGSM